MYRFYTRVRRSRKQVIPFRPNAATPGRYIAMVTPPVIGLSLYAYMHACTCMHTHTHIIIYIYIYTHTHTYNYIYTPTYAYTPGMSTPHSMKLDHGTCHKTPSWDTGRTGRYAMGSRAFAWRKQQTGQISQHRSCSQILIPADSSGNRSHFFDA